MEENILNNEELAKSALSDKFDSLPDEVPQPSENLLLELRHIIFDLNEPLEMKEINVNDIINKLEDLFKKGYTRNYSDAYNIITGVMHESSSDKYEGLSNKIKVVYAACKESALEKDKKHEILRLLDYFQLECIRFKDYGAEKKTIEDIKELSKVTNKLNQQAKDNQNSSITMFTIFSAVILAFSGGISFSSGVFEGLRSVSPCRITFICCLTGFVIFNTIFMLLYVVSKLIDKDIGTRCKYSTLGSKRDYCENCRNERIPSFWCKLYYRYPYVLVVNFILIGIMLATFLIWILAYPENPIPLMFEKNFIGLIVIGLIIVIAIILVLKKAKHKIK